MPLLLVFHLHQDEGTSVLPVKLDGDPDVGPGEASRKEEGCLSLLCASLIIPGRYVLAPGGGEVVVWHTSRVELNF